MYGLDGWLVGVRLGRRMFVCVAQIGGTLLDARRSTYMKARRFSVALFLLQYRLYIRDW